MRHRPVWTDGNCTLWVGDGPYSPTYYDAGGKHQELQRERERAEAWRAARPQPRSCWSGVGRELAKLALKVLAMLAIALLAVVFVRATQGNAQ